GAGLGQCGEVAVVDQLEPHPGDADFVHRLPAAGAGPARRHDIADAVAAENRDPAVVNPRRGAPVQAREDLADAEARLARSRAPFVAAGVDEKDVALLDCDSLCFLRLLEVLDIDRFAEVQPVPSLEPGYVEQNATADNPVLPDLNRVRQGSDGS